MSLVLSATQIETFDPTTTWGCNRKWYFGWVRKLKGPPDKSLILGDAVHQTIEQYLKTGHQGVLHAIALPGVQNLINYRPRVKMIEHRIELGQLEVAGVPIVGKIDAVAPAGPFELIDWKTTSSIGRYAKTKGQLRESVQMNLYARYLYEFFDELGLDEMLYTLGYFGTKKREHDLVSVSVPRKENDDCLLRIEETVTKMVSVAAETDLERVAPNEAVCNIGFGCPHRAYCPRSGSFNMASLLDSFFKTAAPAAPEPAGQPEPEIKPDPDPVPVVRAEGVLSPDAAPRDEKVRKTLIVEDPPAPAQVGPPAEALADLAETKKGPGRPKGSKNKPKDFKAPEGPPAPAETVAAPDTAAVSVPSTDQVPAGSNPAETAPAPSGTSIQIKTMSIRHAAKFGMPDFSSINVEVEMGAAVVGDASKAREELSMFVKAAMIKEMELYVKKAEEQLKKKAEDQAAKQGK